MSGDGRGRPRRQKGPGRPRRGDSEQTRARILDTARANFSLHGYADTPISALADAAGVTSGSIYYYFGSKAGLYEAVAADARTRLNETFIDPVLGVTRHQDSLTARLTTLVNVVAHRARDDMDLHRFGLAADLEAEHFPEVRAFRDNQRGDLRRFYIAVAGLEPDDTLTPEEEELVGFIEMLTLGAWYFIIRPGGIDRLPIFVQAFGALLEDRLFGEPAPRRRPATASRARA